MTPNQTVKWSEDQDAAGKRDAFGGRFSDWIMARYQPDGRVMRNGNGRPVFETQAEFKARHSAELNALASSSAAIKCNGAAWGIECPKRLQCAHHNAHQLASIGEKGRLYSLSDAHQGWTLMACQDLEALEAFSDQPPLSASSQEAKPAKPEQPRIGETLDLFA